MRQMSRQNIIWWIFELPAFEYFRFDSQFWENYSFNNPLSKSSS